MYDRGDILSLVETSPSLHIRLKRHSDGSASITCTRADGSVTWQRQPGQLGLVFPPHDLTHLAVETVLGYRGAFYGLVADGWDINDFAPPFPRGEIPAEARVVELLVGSFDSERRGFSHWTTEEFNAHTAMRASALPPSKALTPRLLTEAELAAVRVERAKLLECWRSLQGGQCLELEFRRGTSVAHTTSSPADAG